MAFQDMTGKKVPNVTFPTRKGGEWVNVTTSDLFDNKTVVVFSLPGAFTPTCSSTHLPRYNELAGEFKKLGVDSIICISVNDTFVMNAWAKDQDAENVILLADGNGEFTEGMGRLVDKANLGFGKRSWRYSMLVKNGEVVKMFDEPEKDGDPFEVSDAETMIKFLNPEWKDQDPIVVFSKTDCPFCAKAKALLAEKGLRFEEIVLDNDSQRGKVVRAVAGSQTVPQIFIGGKLIGGSDALEAYFAK